MHCLIFCHTWLWWQWIWARKFESRHILIFEHVGSHCPQFYWYLNNWFCPYIWIFGYLLPTFFLGIWIFWSVDTPATLSYRIQFTSAEKIHVYLYVISHSWHLLWRTFVFWHGCKLTSFWLFCVDKCCNWKLRLSERQLFQQQKKKSRCPCLEGISQFCVTAALLREKKFLLCLCPYMGKNLSALPRNNIPPIYQQSIPPQNLATIRSFTCQFMYTPGWHGIRFSLALITFVMLFLIVMIIGQKAT